jgi:aerobic carbon-monoxide dehydrogenase medium subunit
MGVVACAPLTAVNRDGVGRVEAMIPGKFAYLAARAVSEAIDVLGRHPDEAKLLAGGQSLIPMMKLRLAAPEILVDISQIRDLAYVREEDGHLVIGALTRESDLESDGLVARRYPMLVDTCRVIADPIVRNLATVGGNLAHADPANDHPATMLALRAQVVASGPNGTRTIPIDDFFVDTFETALEPAEILTAIRVPAPDERSGGAYLKLERKVGDYGIAGAAAYLVLDGNGRVQQVGIGLTNVGPKPLRARDAETFLAGLMPTEENLRGAAERAAAASAPTSDLRGPAEYKRAVVRTLTLRALSRAVERAQNGHASQNGGAA